MVLLLIEERLDSLWDLYKTKFPDSPYENLIDISVLELKIRAVDLAVRIHRKSISKVDLDENLKQLYDSDSYKLSHSNPFAIAARGDKVLEIYDIFKHLITNRVRDRMVYEESMEIPFRTESQPLDGLKLAILKHLHEYPLDSYTSVAAKLDCHSTTIKQNLDCLKRHHQLQICSYVDRWAFDLETLIVSFTPRNPEKWDEIREQIIKFPFYYKMSEDVLNGNHYVCLLFPNISSKLDHFKRSFKDYAERVFTSWNLHEGLSAYMYSNIDLITSRKLCLSPVIEKKIVQSEGTSEINYRTCKRSAPNTLNIRDLYVAQLLVRDARMKPPDISRESLKHLGIEISPNEAYYRKKKLILNNALEYYLSWAYPYSTNIIRFDVLCEKKDRDVFLSTFNECHGVLFFISKEGIIFWVVAPAIHTNAYFEYYKFLSQSLGLEQASCCISKNWTGGRGYNRILEKWNYYREDGSKKKSFDLSTNIFDYL